MITTRQRDREDHLGDRGVSGCLVLPLIFIVESDAGLFRGGEMDTQAGRRPGRMGASVGTLEPATEPGSSGRWMLLIPHRARLVRLATRKLGSVAEAEDCVHEAMLRTCQFAGLDDERVGSFLSTVVARICVDRHRAGKRAQAAWARLSEPRQEGPEDSVCERLAGAWLMGLLDDFPARERWVLAARAEGLSTREAARRLGISQKAAESAFTRARAKMLAHAAAA